MSRRYAKNGCRRPEKRAVRVDAMSEDFGKWLEKNDAWFASYHEWDKKDVHPSHRTRYVSVRALGEWHLGVTKECIEIQKEAPSNTIIICGLLHREFAFACLGKKEVERRLYSRGRE